jgi:hypothetical protein
VRPVIRVWRAAWDLLREGWWPLLLVGLPAGLGTVWAGALVLRAGPWSLRTLAGLGAAAAALALGTGTVWAAARTAYGPLPVGRSLPAAAALAATAVAGVAGAALGIVPGVWLLVRWSLAPVVAVAEGGGPGAALRRSAALVAGRFGFVLLVLGATGVGLVLLARGLDAWASGLPAWAARSWAGGVAALTAAGRAAVVTALHGELAGTGRP